VGLRPRGTNVGDFATLGVSSLSLEHLLLKFFELQAKLGRLARFRLLGGRVNGMQKDKH
jgi:hypothetical protein